MENWMIDTVGMLGTLLVVLAYYLLQLERIDPRGLSYNILNFAGAACLLISLCFNFNLASFVIEIFWIVASLIGLWKYWGRQGAAGQSSN
jgi:hypothetical protein